MNGQSDKEKFKIREFEDKDFEALVRSILIYSCRYLPKTLIEMDIKPEVVDRRILLHLTYEGFKKAQVLLLNELKSLQTLKQIKHDDLKQARRDKNYSQKQLIHQELRLIDYKKNVLKNLQDAIAWQMLCGKIHVIRRLYTDEAGDKNLLEKSFEAVVDLAEEINGHPEQFALISDLTTFVQLGDLLIANEKGIHIHEVKTGKTNKCVKNLIDFYQVNKLPIDFEILNQKYPPKFAKHILRYKKQIEKIEKAIQIVENDYGQDPKYDIDVYISDSPSQLYYHDIFHKMFKKVQKDTWAYEIIEGIVHIGMYSKQSRVAGRFLITKLVQEGSHENFPVFNLLDCIRIPMTESIFLKPFLPKHALDIVFGRIQVFIGINLNTLIKLFNAMGLNARWASRKKTAQFKRMCPIPSAIFEYKKRGISLKSEKQDTLLGYGAFFRIVFDLMLPTSLAASLRASENITPKALII